MADYTPNSRTIKLEGFAEFEQQLRDMANMYRAETVARQTLVKAANDAMMPVLYTAGMNAPYDEKNDGPIHLRNTIRLDARIPNNKDKQSQYVNETDAVIAVVSAKKSAVSLAQEFGTSRIPAQPFLRPALDSQADQVVAILKEKLAILIPEAAKKLRRRKQ
jgi:HK97 gp10 family phage protein